MKRASDSSSFRLPKWISIAMTAFIVWTIVSAGSGTGPVMASGSDSGSGRAQSAPDVVCPGGQCFHDVTISSPFYTSTNNLYIDNIVSGYACGGLGEPCDTHNTPYYRPNNNVTRAQMSKFVDNGRRNIADALGHSLVMTNPTGISIVLSNTTTDSLDAYNSSGAEAIQSICTRANQNCWAFYSSAQAGDYAGVFSGGRGVNASSSDAGYPGVSANASGNGADSYGLKAGSDNYRGGYVKSSSTSFYTLYVDTQGGPTQNTPALYTNGSIYDAGNLFVTGSKTGYVVDIMQNADSQSLEPGDVVSVVGTSAPVLGEIPAVLVKKSTMAYDTAIVGVVDQVMYVPDEATKAAYDKQEAAIRTAQSQRNQLMAAAAGDNSGTKPDPFSIPMPDANITDEQGMLHAIPEGTQVLPNGYLSAVTLGSYKGIKVDASYGAIHVGDLLVASPHAGYAMKATDRSLASGATIGKAMGNLETGTGLIPVMVTLK